MRLIIWFVVTLLALGVFPGLLLCPGWRGGDLPWLQWESVLGANSRRCMAGERWMSVDERG